LPTEARPLSTSFIGNFQIPGIFRIGCRGNGAGYLYARKSKSSAQFVGSAQHAAPALVGRSRQEIRLAGIAAESARMDSQQANFLFAIPVALQKPPGCQQYRAILIG
jgi:hypothetical protein